MVKWIFISKILTIPHCLLYIPYLLVYREAIENFGYLSTGKPSKILAIMTTLEVAPWWWDPARPRRETSVFSSRHYKWFTGILQRLFCCLYPFLGFKLMKKVGNLFYLTLLLHFLLFLVESPRRIRWNLKFRALTRACLRARHFVMASFEANTHFEIRACCEAFPSYLAK